MYIQQTAIAGIAFRDQWFFTASRYRRRAVEHVGVDCQTGIGIIQIGRHGSKAGHVKRLRTREVGELCRHQVDNTGAVMNCFAFSVALQLFKAMVVSCVFTCVVRGRRAIKFGIHKS
jgi:hypothetical protein